MTRSSSGTTFRASEQTALVPGTPRARMAIVLGTVQAPGLTPAPGQEKQLSAEHRPAALRLPPPALGLATLPAGEIHAGELENLARMLEVGRGAELGDDRGGTGGADLRHREQHPGLGALVDEDRNPCFHRGQLLPH